MLNLIAAVLIAFVCGSSSAIATYTATGRRRNYWIAIAIGSAIGTALNAVVAYRDLASTP